MPSPLPPLLLAVAYSFDIFTRAHSPHNILLSLTSCWISKPVENRHDDDPKEEQTDIRVNAKHMHSLYSTSFLIGNTEPLYPHPVVPLQLRTTRVHSLSTHYLHILSNPTRKVKRSESSTSPLVDQLSSRMTPKIRMSLGCRLRSYSGSEKVKA